MQIKAVSSVYGSFPNIAFKVHRKYPVLAESIFVTTEMLESASHNKGSIKLIKKTRNSLN